MEVNGSEKRLLNDSGANSFVAILRANEVELELEQAQLYYEFPLYKDIDGDVVVSKLLLVSPYHGVLVIGTSTINREENFKIELVNVDTEIEQVFTALYARLIKNGELKETRQSLKFPMSSALFFPFISTTKIEFKIDSEVLFTDAEVVNFLRDQSLPKIIPDEVFKELISTIEGAKGIIKHKAREIPDEGHLLSKGILANNLENEISTFDQRQKYYMTVPEGVERIRGLAGSGKTVVLALKAALTHLRDPDARILYTFHTHSLYQHIQRMITRFYRQFDERDPDWSKLKIMHGWGGASAEGVYYNACIQNGITPLSYSAAFSANRLNPFDYACSKLLKETNIKPMFDYVFVDEGQDFPISFLKIVVRLAEDNRMVYAYDELQTIFQKKAPSPADFLRPGAKLADDVTFYKCYRNPREILGCVDISA